jgi:4-aminobutyrate aminotransferase-like enzyme
MLALALTSKTHPYKAGLAPFAPEVYRVPFDDLDAIRRAFTTLVAAEDVAAIVVEPVQGEGGFLPASPAFLRGLRELCDEHGIVFVCDEVQTGFGRTGRFFAIEHSGVEPDLIVVAKSIAGGLPLSGVLGKAAVMDAAHEGSIGGTYVGNPVAQAAALAVLDVIETEGLVQRAAEIGEILRARMEAWQARWTQIAAVRGLGAMLAVELTDADLATRVVEQAFNRGLLLLKAGVNLSSIRVLMPLVISDAELDEALAVWEEALEAAL